MPTEVTGVGGGSNAGTVRNVGSQDISSDQFLRLLVTQLQNQDPLNPMNNEEFLTQLAQLQSLQKQMETADNTKNLLLAQNIGAASALLGKAVTAMSGGYATSGTVEKVLVSNGQVSLVVGGREIALSDVTEVRGEVK
jgi:flagellar basal-body rod modification protein FlgD